MASFVYEWRRNMSIENLGI